MSVSRELTGIGIVSGSAPGVAIGRAHLLGAFELDIAKYAIGREDALHEVARLNNAFSVVRAEFDQLRASVTAEAPTEVGAFLDLHRMILDDSALCDVPRDVVRQKLINAEWALSLQLEVLCRQFESIDDEYLRERSQDVRQVVDRVMKALALGSTHAAAPAPKVAEGERLILVARDMSPADVMQLKDRADLDVAGFVCELGGSNSHTAILARSLGLPAVLGVHGAREAVQEGDLVVIDAEAGRLHVIPDQGKLTEFRARLRAQLEHRLQLRKLKGKTARSLDGYAVQLFANIEMPEDAREALDAGADGIGLYRTEFLFMNRDRLPGEDEQFDAYAKVVKAMKGKPVVIRTLDIGSDKVLNEAARLSLGMADSAPTVESNPALGLRAIRYCLAYPDLFLTQLRAILRASAHGTVRILVPMLAHLHEVEQSLVFVARAKESLKDSKHKFDARVPVGGMIEVPAAALSMSAFVKRMKFFSIGTNDLIQYTLAIDRADASVAHLYDHLHPAVLQLIARTLRIGEKAHTPVAVCGEMAGLSEMTELLLGMGLREFSMHPSQLLSVKERLMGLTTANAAKLAARVLRSDDPLEVRQQIEKAWARKVVP